jgi:hypothetical protein
MVLLADTKNRSHAQSDALLRRDNLSHPLHMVKIKLPPFPPIMEAWRSRNFLASVYQEENGVVRISINRTAIDHKTGHWVDGITWDEIQCIKSEMGHGDKFAVEIYPPDKDVVNVAAMRHIWLLDQAPAFAWVRS